MDLRCKAHCKEFIAFCNNADCQKPVCPQCLAAHSHHNLLDGAAFTTMIQQKAQQLLKEVQDSLAQNIKTQEKLTMISTDATDICVSQIRKTLQFLERVLLSYVRGTAEEKAQIQSGVRNHTQQLIEQSRRIEQALLALSTAGNFSKQYEEFLKLSDIQPTKTEITDRIDKLFTTDKERLDVKILPLVSQELEQTMERIAKIIGKEHIQISSKDVANEGILISFGLHYCRFECKAHNRGL